MRQAVAFLIAVALRAAAGAVVVDALVMIPVQKHTIRLAVTRPLHMLRRLDAGHRDKAHPGLDQPAAKQVAIAAVIAAIPVTRLVRLARKIEGMLRLIAGEQVERVLRVALHQLPCRRFRHRADIERFEQAVPLQQTPALQALLQFQRAHLPLRITQVFTETFRAEFPRRAAGR